MMSDLDMAEFELGMAKVIAARVPVKVRRWGWYSSSLPGLDLSQLRPISYAWRPSVARITHERPYEDPRYDRERNGARAQPAQREAALSLRLIPHADAVPILDNRNGSSSQPRWTVGADEWCSVEGLLDVHHLRARGVKCIAGRAAPGLADVPGDVPNVVR